MRRLKTPAVVMVLVGVLLLGSGPGGLAPCAARAWAPTRIQHSPAYGFVPGFRIALRATIKDDAPVTLVRCYFRAVGSGATDFLFVEMTGGEGGDYLAVLPAPAPTTATIEYVLVAVTGQKDVVRTQAFVINRQDGTKPTPWQTDGRDGTLVVRTEQDRPPAEVHGFTDSVAVDRTEPAARFGYVVAGLYAAAQMGTAAPSGYRGSTVAAVPVPPPATTTVVVQAPASSESGKKKMSGVTLGLIIGGGVAAAAGAALAAKGGSGTSATTTTVPTTTTTTTAATTTSTTMPTTSPTTAPPTTSTTVPTTTPTTAPPTTTTASAGTVSVTIYFTAGAGPGVASFTAGAYLDGTRLGSIPYVPGTVSFTQTLTRGTTHTARVVLEAISCSGPSCYVMPQIQTPYGMGVPLYPLPDGTTNSYSYTFTVALTGIQQP